MKRFAFYLLGAALWLAGCPLAQAEDADFVPLFDGDSLKGWHGYQLTDIPKAWSVHEKQILCNGEPGPDLVSDKKYTNFELRFEWKISPGGDSGVVYRVLEDDKELKESRHSGLEFQLLDDKTREPKSPVSAAASLFALYGAEEKELKVVGEFNQCRIVVRGNHIQHWLNEAKVVDCNIDSEDWKKKVAASELSKWKGFAKQPSGHIALQNAGSKVWFRNITIKELKLEAEE